MKKFFRRHGGRCSYDLFSSYSHFLPGVGGLFGIFALFMLGALLGNILVLGLQFISPEFAKEYGIIISYPLMFIPAMLYASAKSRFDENFTPGFKMDSNNFGRFSGIQIAAIVTVATLATAFMTDAISSLMPPMPEWLEATMKELLHAPFWITLISVSVFAPLFEEWLCRGIVLRSLLTKYSPATAIIVSAVFFAIIHFNPWQAIPAFILGLLFGYVYYKTGSLKLTMLMHCANNTMAAVFSRIPALEEAKSFIDVMNPWTYAGIFICSAAFVVAAIIVFAGIPHKEGNLGGCDKA
jgi:membrane protease YdiL (CAAX protease family)